MIKKLINRILPGRKNVRKHQAQSRKSQSGQVLIIVVFAITGLIMFVGLVVDTGLLFIANGKLRRGTDAAALAAAAEYRKSPNLPDLKATAKEYLVLNGVDSGTADVFLICDPSGAMYDPNQCYPAKRRLVRVDTHAIVKLAFLPVLGINDIPINATATSEAASLDIVLLMDTSESMTWDNMDLVHGYGLNLMADPVECNVPAADGYTNCQPFRDIQRAAVQFVTTRFNPRGSNQFDRVAIIPFDRKAHVDGDPYNAPLHLDINADNHLDAGSYMDLIISKIRGLRVFTASGTVATGGPLSDGSCLNASGALTYPGGAAPCRYYPYAGDGYCLTDDNKPISQVVTDVNPVANDSSLGDLSCFTPDPGGPYHSLDGSQHYQRAFDFFACPPGVPYANCGTTATGDALRAAGEEFVRPTGFRQQSLWIVILLTDGVANHAQGNLYCPVSTSSLCQDTSVKTRDTGTRHCRLADDPIYADNGFLHTACMAAPPDGGGGVEDVSAYDNDDYARDMADFVALGQSALVYTIGFGNAVHANSNMGEQLLNYAADIGDNAKVDTPEGSLNSDYFFAPDATALNAIFQTINDRIATRITQ